MHAFLVFNAIRLQLILEYHFISQHILQVIAVLIFLTNVHFNFIITVTLFLC